jgi:phage baseplate assembly protein W
MGNKVMTFGNTSYAETVGNVLHPMEVFKDVSMTSNTTSKNGSYEAKVGKNVNVVAVQKALDNVFTWFPGERILLPEFGSRLRSLLYEGITPITEERIIAEIHRCVTEWEPRASIMKIVNVSVVDDTEDNTIHLQVVFTIPQLNDEQYTYSFTYHMGTT